MFGRILSDRTASTIAGTTAYVTFELERGEATGLDWSPSQAQGL
jgi:hypothetical protein